MRRTFPAHNARTGQNKKENRNFANTYSPKESRNSQEASCAAQNKRRPDAFLRKTKLCAFNLCRPQEFRLPPARGKRAQYRYKDARDQTKKHKSPLYHRLSRLRCCVARYSMSQTWVGRSLRGAVCRSYYGANGSVEESRCFRQVCLMG